MKSPTLTLQFQGDKDVVVPEMTLRNVRSR
jgi:hypothetical protein